MSASSTLFVHSAVSPIASAVTSIQAPAHSVPTGTLSVESTEVADPLAEVESTCPPRPTPTNATAKIDAAPTEHDRVAPLGRMVHPCAHDMAASLADRPTPSLAGTRDPCEFARNALQRAH